MPASYNMALVGGFGPPTGLVAGQAPAKPISSYTLVGTSPPRVDIPAKVTGTYTYVQNVRVPGMLHGRVVRPRGQGAWGAGAPIVSVDPSSIAHIPNAQIVQKGNFLGVVAPHEWDAIQAAAQLKVTWKDDPILPGTGNLFGAMRSETTSNAVQASSGNASAGLASAATVLSHSYSYPYNGHLPIGPMCCVADVTQTDATIFSSTQSIEGLAGTVAAVLGMTPAQVRVKYYEGSGSYGSNTQEDVAQAAATMSQVIGKPVRVQFMRWDEHGWDFYGPSHTVDLTAGVDSHGNIVGYNYNGWQIPYYTILNTAELLGYPTPDPSQGFTAFGYIDTSNTGGQYTIPNLKVTSKAVPVLDTGYFKVTFLRAPSGQQALFASEQMIDELAYAAKMDPVAFRRQNIATANDPAAGSPGGGAWIGVLDAVAKAAELAAEGRGLRARKRQRRHRPRDRARRLRQLAGRRRRRDHTEQVDRQDQGRPPLRGPGQRTDDQPRPRREPDVRQPDPGALARLARAGHVRQEPRHEPRLGHLPDPPLRGLAAGDDGLDPAEGPAVDRLG